MHVLKEYECLLPRIVHTVSCSKYVNLYIFDYSPLCFTACTLYTAKL